MSAITFSVDYAASFRRGVSCPLPPRVTIEVDPASLSPEDRELLASRLRDNGEVASRSETNGLLYSSPCTVTADEPTVAGVLNAIRAEQKSSATYAERTAAKERVAHEERRAFRLAEWRRQPTLQTLQVHVSLLPDGEVRTDESHVPAGAIETALAQYEREYIVYYTGDALTPEENQQYRERHDQLDRESGTRRQAAIDMATEQLRANHWQPRLDWIAAHGSPRLKRLAKEGIPFARTYESERKNYDEAQYTAALEAERPGWVAVAQDDLVTTVADVSLRTLALLDAARAIAPAARLGKLKSSGKYVAYEEFGGRLIVWPKE